MENLAISDCSSMVGFLIVREILRLHLKLPGVMRKFVIMTVILSVGSVHKVEMAWMLTASSFSVKGHSYVLAPISSFSANL